MTLGYNKDRSVEWYTPREIFEALGLEFDLDPCSPGPDVVPWIPAKKHYTRPVNGLLEPWTGRVWLNPPYGDGIRGWIERLAGHGNGIALVTSRTESRWFQEVARTCLLGVFVRGRIHFCPASFAKVHAAGEPIPGFLSRVNLTSCLLAWGEANAEAVAHSGLGEVFTFRR